MIRHDIDKNQSRSLSRAAVDSELPRVTWQSIQLQQVIINLLVNSVQAIAQPGQPTRRIDIQTSIDEEGSVCFSVFDNGPGIAARGPGACFRPLLQHQDAGIGIGLAICQSIITAHGGSISGSNHPSGGAWFLFTLPNADSCRARYQRRRLRHAHQPFNEPLLRCAIVSTMAFIGASGPTIPKYRSVYPLETA